MYARLVFVSLWRLIKSRAKASLSKYTVPPTVMSVSLCSLTITILYFIVNLVAGLGFEPRMAKAYETSLVTRPSPRYSVTVIYVWSLGRDLNPRINGFAIRAIEPLWYRDTSSYVNTLSSPPFFCVLRQMCLSNVFAYKVAD